MKRYLEIFTTFFKIGLFTFGGGYSMLPLLNKEVAQNRKWATEDEIMDFYSVSQCLPGIIAINTSIFVGYKVKGVPGGVMAAMGAVAPSLIIILIIASCISNFLDIEYVQYALAGVRIGVCAIVTHTIIEMFRKNIQDYFTCILFIAAFIASFVYDVSTIIMILSFSLVGYGLLQVKKGMKR